MRFVDTHAHLYADAFASDRTACIERACASSVEGIINAGTDSSSSRAAVRLARRPGVWALGGVHPHQAAAAGKGLDWLEQLLERDEVLGVGEIGLDYHYDFSPRPVQVQVFSRQLALAKKHGALVVVHNREADADCLDLLRRELSPGHPVLLHCFSGDVALMEEVLDRGYYIALGGVVTFKKATQTHEVARQVRLDRLVLETDAPYLAPHPKRGRRNEPAFIPLIAERIAQLRGISVEEVAAETTATAETFFGRHLGGGAGTCSI